ncbi:MAG: mechanosensitive ion channel family protein [Candidatus Aquicultor sp.]|nr:mechanosensitive ion channel family protein [Candidatus Aquicultor sp.]
MNEDTATIEGRIVSISDGFQDLYYEFVRWVPSIIIAIVVLVISLFVAKMIRNMARRAMAKTSTEGHIDILVAQLAHIGALALGIIMSLSLLPINLSALFTGLGLAGFAIGFAMKDILGNFLAGIILLIQRPFTIDDYVKIGDVEGTVTNIRVRDTQLTTNDGRLIFVPNNTMSTSNIINLTALPLRRVDVDVDIPYSSDINRAVKACLEAATRLPGFVERPIPDVIVTEFGDSAVMLRVQIWVDWKEHGYIQVQSEALKLVKAALDDAGIDIPFPVRTVYLHQSKDS